MSSPKMTRMFGLRPGAMAGRGGGAGCACVCETCPTVRPAAARADVPVRSMWRRLNAPRRCFFSSFSGRAVVVMVVPSLSVASPSFEKKSWTWALSCQSAAPVGCDVVVGGKLHVHGLAADLEHPPEAASDRQGPAVAVAGFPIRGDDRRRRQVPAAGKIVVHEGLQRHGVDGVAVVLACDGPDVVDEHSDH